MEEELDDARAQEAYHAHEDARLDALLAKARRVERTRAKTDDEGLTAEQLVSGFAFGLGVDLGSDLSQAMLWSLIETADGSRIAHGVSGASMYMRHVVRVLDRLEEFFAEDQSSALQAVRPRVAELQRRALELREQLAVLEVDRLVSENPPLLSSERAAVAFLNRVAPSAKGGT